MNEVRVDVQVKATREGGAVERCHGTPHVGSYSVAQHSFGAVSLLLLLHPNPTVELVKLVQWHDVAERWLGDIPSPAKWAGPEFTRLYETAEIQILLKLDLAPDVSGDDLDWLRAVDILELWLWTGDQLNFGNSNIRGMRIACEEVVLKLRSSGLMPESAAAFYDARRELGNSRLPDIWPEVEGLLYGPQETGN